MPSPQPTPEKTCPPYSFPLGVVGDASNGALACSNGIVLTAYSNKECGIRCGAAGYSGGSSTLTCDTTGVLSGRRLLEDTAAGPDPTSQPTGVPTAQPTAPPTLHPRIGTLVGGDLVCVDQQDTCSGASQEAGPGTCVCKTAYYGTPVFGGPNGSPDAWDNPCSRSAVHISSKLSLTGIDRARTQ